MTRQHDFYLGAFEEGKQAYLDNYKLKDNPYNAVRETLLYDAWQDGYLEAQIEDEESYDQ